MTVAIGFDDAHMYTDADGSGSWAASAVGDVNGDGRTDVVLAGPDEAVSVVPGVPK